MTLRIVAVAFVSSSNAPLLVQAFDDSISDKDSLLFHILVHCSLDAVEELQRVKDTKQQRASGTQQQLQQHRDGYLGHLSTSDGYRMYGHLTNTNVKIILIMEDRVEEHYFKKTEIQKVSEDKRARGLG